MHTDLTWGYLCILAVFLPSTVVLSARSFGSHFILSPASLIMSIALMWQTLQTAATAKSNHYIKFVVWQLPGGSSTFWLEAYGPLPPQAPYLLWGKDTLLVKEPASSSAHLSFLTFSHLYVLRSESQCRISFTFHFRTGDYFLVNC